MSDTSRSNHPLKKRIDYFDLLRTVAIFFVILIHCTAPLFKSLSIDSPNWLITNLFESISRWAVPIFVMISGSIHLNRRRDFKTFFRKNILKLIIILFSWNFIYATVNFITDDHSIKNFIYDFIGGHYHLWFLYMLIGLYLITPFLKTFLNNPKNVKLFLLISFIFGIALPELSDIFTVLPSRLNIIGSSLKHVADITGFGNLFGFSFYYLLGYYLHHQTFNAKTKKIIYFAGFIGFLITFAATWGFSSLTNSPIVIFLKDLTVNNILLSAAIFTYAKCHIKKTTITNPLILISKYSLGVYVTHALILENLLIFLPQLPVILEIPVKAILCFLISLTLTFCLHKIPILKKIV